MRAAILLLLGIAIGLWLVVGGMKIKEYKDSVWLEGYKAGVLAEGESK